MTDLIDAATMASLVELDTSAMPSVCTIYSRALTETASGGSKRGAPVARNMTPLRCRVTPRNLQRNWTVIAATVESPESVDISIEVAGYKAQNVVVELDDLIDVTTTTQNPDGTAIVSTTRYKVAGKPAFGSYSTNVPVPASVT